MLTTALITFVILASAALIIDELNLSPYKTTGMLLLKRSPIGLAMYVAAVEKKEYLERKNALDAQLSIIRLLIPWDRYSFVSGKTLMLCIKPSDLHRTRAALRSHYGTWSDAIDKSSTYCSDSYVTIKYTSPRHPVIISVDYDIDAIPDGLLKDGCRIERETQVTTTCRIVCAT